MKYPTEPINLGEFDVSLTEMMYYLYLPIKMAGHETIKLPDNVEQLKPLVNQVAKYCSEQLGRDYDKDYYYLSARKGWATPDNPLNRPGWHCDGFGTEDANFAYWIGHGTRFSRQEFKEISDSHILSLKQFEDQVEWDEVYSPPEKTLYYLSPRCVHTTPAMPSRGAMRQFIKISVSTQRYNLEDNSHNYLFDYKWEMQPRAAMRNDPHRAQRDYP